MNPSTTRSSSTPLLRGVALLVLALGLLLPAARVLAQSITDVVVPQYLEAANSTTRLPAVFRVTLSGLAANTTYRYFPQAVISTDIATSNGAGNPLFLDASYTFYSTSASLATPGTTCSQFTTDATGAYTGWMGLVPTGNARFTAGNTVYLRVNLNDGAGGTTVVTRLTTTAGAAAIAFGAAAGNGTGIYQQPSFTAKDVVLLYDNTAGTGRPLATGIVQNEGATVASAVTYYATYVDGISGAWGTIIPNTLPGGVQRVEERAFADGSIVQQLVDSDGIWDPGAISTINPIGGTTAIELPQSVVVPAVPQSWGMLKTLYR
jgi:hypothetical protein